jgi:hypothetical protein
MAAYPQGAREVPSTGFRPKKAQTIMSNIFNSLELNQHESGGNIKQPKQAWLNILS